MTQTELNIASKNTENDVNVLDVTPLGILIEQTANRMIAVDGIQFQLDQLQQRINDHIAEQFPELAMLQDELTNAREALQESQSMMKAKSLQVERDALKQYNNAITIATVQSVLHFDKDEALKYIQQNRLKSERLGLVEIKTLPSWWQKAMKNGHTLPSEIIQIDTIEQVRVKDKLIKEFARGD